MAEFTLECGGCGGEEFRLQFNHDGDTWAECSECGRPTGVVGIGREKQRLWEAENDA